MASGSDAAAPSVVLLHGFGQHPDSWDDACVWLEQAGMRVVTPSLMGLHAWGCVDVDSPGDEVFARNACALGDVCRAVECLLRDERERTGVDPVLVGYSMGGRIALETAVQARRRGATLPVSALILESAGLGPVDDSHREVLRARNGEWAQRVRDQGVENFMAWWADLPLFATQRALPHKQRERLREGRLSNSVSGIAFQLEGWGQHNQAFYAESLACLREMAACFPVAYYSGEVDGKYCAIAHDVADAVPRARVRLFPGVGHCVHLEAPGDFAHAVMEIAGEAVWPIP